nr:MAG TPA: hypothetical protein [Caudoviricetes sp.]
MLLVFYSLLSLLIPSRSKSLLYSFLHFLSINP